MASYFGGVFLDIDKQLPGACVCKFRRPTYNTKGQSFSAAPHPKAGRGPQRSLGSWRYYTTCCVRHRTGGSRGSGRGYHPLSTQRATRSLLVVVLPPVAFAVLLILWIFGS